MHQSIRFLNTIETTQDGYLKKKKKMKASDDFFSVGEKINKRNLHYSTT